MGLVGNPEPRLLTEPGRPLTRATTRGYEVCEFAELLGEPLLPWQQTAVKRALELNPDGTYRYRVVVILVGRQSGKSHLLRTVALWRMYLDGARLVVGAAQDLGTAREVWQASVDMAKAAPDLADEVANVRYANGEQCLTLANGARYIIRATSRSAGRGLSVDLLLADELREWRTWEPWAALAPTTQARRNGQIWVASNAGDDESVVLSRLREQALSGGDETICLLEWSAPENCDVDDTEAWTQALPGLGHIVTEQAIRTNLATFPPARFRTECLCQWVSTLDEAVSLTAWAECADPGMTLESARDRVCVGVDVAPDGQHVTAVAAATGPNGTVRLEVVGAWASTQQARTELPGLLEKVDPRTVAWFPSGPAAALANVLRARTNLELGGGKVTEACQTFADMVVARRIVHTGDPLLTAQLSQATRMPVGDAWRFARRGGVGHVDSCYAAAAALQACLSVPDVPAPNIRWLGSVA